MPYAICIAGPDQDLSLAVAHGLAAQLEKMDVSVGLVTNTAAKPTSGGPQARVSLGGGGISVSRRSAEDLNLDQIMGRYLAGLDLVISLAHPGEKKAKIEVVPSGEAPGMLKDGGLRALVGADLGEVDKPVFSPEDPAGLAEYVTQQIMPKRELPTVRILLEGKRLPIKEFVQDILAKTIRGMVSSLRGGDKPGRLEIYID